MRSTLDALVLIHIDKLHGFFFLAFARRSFIAFLFGFQTNLHQSFIARRILRVPSECSRCSAYGQIIEVDL